MTRRVSAAFAAFLFSLTILAPTGAAAQHWRRGDDDDRRYEYRRDHDDRGYDRHDGRRYDRHYDRRRHRDRDDDDGDALAAGVLGLIVGAAIVSALNEGQQNRQHSQYQEPYYPDSRSAYEQDYGDYQQQRSQCTRRERQWDRYANRYVMVDVPC